MPEHYDDDTPDADDETHRSLFHEAGMSGLNMAGGRPHEEWLPQLQGGRGMRTYKEMVDNDPIIGGIISGYEEVLRSVDWMLIPADNTPQAQAAAEFVDTCRADMSITWSQLISDILSKLTFGWSYFEVVYKRRQGRDVKHHEAASKFDDGLIGWRKIALRAQDTIDHWEVDHHGGIQGMWQKIEQGTVFLPIERCLLFRTTTKKNNPEGRSVLRNAYSSWWAKKRVEMFELIGIERDLAGIPSFGLPPAMFDPDAPAAVKGALDDYKKAASQLRRDEQSSLVWPMYRDENGNMEIEIGLLKSPGTRQHNTEGVIERYARYMAISTLQDVIMMGHEQVGSFALAETKKQMSLASMRTQLNEIAEVFNRYELPRLLALNGIDEELTPTLRPGEITERDLVQLAQIIKATSDAGFAWFPNESIQNELLTLLGFDPIAFNSDADTMTVAPSIDATAIASVDDDFDTIADEVEDAETEAEIGIEMGYGSGGRGGGGGGGGGISEADEERLRRHAESQSPAHMRAMRRFMRQGMSFAAAHRAAMNAVERAAPGDVRSGTWVQYDVPKPPGATERATGRVTRVASSGELSGGEETFEASQDDPVALIAVWARMDDDTFQETDRQVARPVSQLRVIAEPDLRKQVSASVRSTLQEKAEEHNEEHGSAISKRVTVPMLTAVFERGVGAYRSNPGSVRPTVTSAEQWAYARVNGFLSAVATGRFRRGAFDRDLLPEGHPLSTRGDVSKANDEEQEQLDAAVAAVTITKESFSPTDAMKDEARRGLEWRRQFGRGGTQVGVSRARDIINRDLSELSVRRMYSFFARHEVDKQAEGFSPGEEGYPSAGRIAWALWGGDAGQRWSRRIVERLDRMRIEKELGETDADADLD